MKLLGGVGHRLVRKCLDFDCDPVFFCKFWIVIQQ